MGSKLIDIPAGRADHVVTDTYDLPVAVDLLSVYPHAHYLGKDMVVTAALPDGVVKTLIHIPQWSLHWQQDYRFVTPIPLPRGTTHDDAVHVRQLGRRTRRTRTIRPCACSSGRRSVDEMAELGLLAPAEVAADATRSGNAFEDRERSRDPSSGAETRVREAPNVADHQAFLGSALRGSRPVRRRDSASRGGAPPRRPVRERAQRSRHGADAAGPLDRRRSRTRSARSTLAPSDETMQFNFGNALAQAHRDRRGRRRVRTGAGDQSGILGRARRIWARCSCRSGKRAGGPGALPARRRSRSPTRPYSTAISAARSRRRADSPRRMQHVRRALEMNPGYAPALENLRRFQQMGIK